MKSFSQKKMVKKMHFISDQEGIMNRYLREQDNWATHLCNTQDFILDSFKKTKIETIAVMGSGWLLDLPLEKLAKKYKKILLLDVHHPAQIKKLTEEYKNVKLHETDLTGGGIKYCWDLRKKKNEHFGKYILDDFKPKKPDLPFKPDAYISLNILNQLDILLVDFLRSKNGRFIDIEFDRFRKTIQKFHLNWITEKPGCLISDIEEINESEKGKTKVSKLVHTKLPKNIRNLEWTWEFDHTGSYRPGKTTHMNVQAIEWK